MAYIFLLTIAILVCLNCYRVSLAADGQDGNGSQLEKLRLLIYLEIKVGRVFLTIRSPGQTQLPSATLN